MQETLDEERKKIELQLNSDRQKIAANEAELQTRQEKFLTERSELDAAWAEMDAATAEFHEELENAKAAHETFIEEEMKALKERQNGVEIELQESLSQIEAVQQEAASLQATKEDVFAKSEMIEVKEVELVQLKEDIDRKTEECAKEICCNIQKYIQGNTG